jgi:hypothetical protein
LFCPIQHLLDGGGDYVFLETVFDPGLCHFPLANSVVRIIRLIPRPFSPRVHAGDKLPNN